MTKKQKELEKDFLPYKQALELKKLGFDEPCFGLSNSLKKIHITYEFDCRFNDKLANQNSDFKNSAYEDFITIPLYSQAFRFFRDKYALNSISPTRIYKTNFYHSRIIDWNTWEEIDVMQCSSYEKSELKCLKKLIEIVKNKNRK